VANDREADECGGIRNHTKSQAICFHPGSPPGLQAPADALTPLDYLQLTCTDDAGVTTFTPGGLDAVHEYLYLGVSVTSDLDFTNDRAAAVKKANGALRCLQTSNPSGSLPPQAAAELAHSLVLSLIEYALPLYGPEPWPAAEAIMLRAARWALGRQHLPLHSLEKERIAAHVLLGWPGIKYRQHQLVACIYGQLQSMPADRHTRRLFDCEQRLCAHQAATAAAAAAAAAAAGQPAPHHRKRVAASFALNVARAVAAAGSEHHTRVTNAEVRRSEEAIQLRDAVLNGAAPNWLPLAHFLQKSAEPAAASAVAPAAADAMVLLHEALTVAAAADWRARIAESIEATQRHRKADEARQMAKEAAEVAVRPDPPARHLRGRVILPVVRNARAMPPAVRISDQLDTLRLLTEQWTRCKGVWPALLVTGGRALHAGSEQLTAAIFGSLPLSTHMHRYYGFDPSGWFQLHIRIPEYGGRLCRDCARTGVDVPEDLRHFLLHCATLQAARIGLGATR
jgi:hypothetical protein